MQSAGGHRGAAGTEVFLVLWELLDEQMWQQGDLTGRKSAPILSSEAAQQDTLFSVTVTLPHGYSTSETSSASSKQAVSSRGGVPM